MGMLLHRHLQGQGVVKSAPKPEKVEEPKLNNEFIIEKKDRANDNKRKNSNGKNISK